MGNTHRPAIVLMADDDDDDYLVTKKAFGSLSIPNRFYRVKDGEELMDYLLGRGKYVDSKQSPIPDIILLDLNMPRKNGHEALEEISNHDVLKMIPVICLSVSHDPEVIKTTYKLGANAFIKKPASFDQLLAIVESLSHFWLSIAALPNTSDIRKEKQYSEAME